MLAFHEAFADIVALFQHFTFPDSAAPPDRAQARGRAGASEPARQSWRVQFGEAIGNHGALRSAIGEHDPETGE